ncbi:membrane protein insertase YidC [Paenirhodobacter enshiensis]|uniref:membrane protein insertase YidC n=1 Tax=Paenirhodobacter enshiensis TaxID=1105367 RepID=UPI0035B272AF
MESQNRNLILATVLSVVVLIGWTYFFPPTKPAEDSTAATEQTTPAAPAASDAVATTTTAAIEAAPTPANAPRIAIDTPDLTGSISLMGGRLDDLSLKKYQVSLDKSSPLVRLLSPAGAEVANGSNPYYVLYGWSPAGGLDPAALPGPKTVWTAPAGAVLTPKTPVTMTWDNGAGLKFSRTVSVDENYLFTIRQSVENTTGAPVRMAPYGIIARHGIPAASHVYVLHEGAVRMTDGKLQETKYSAITKLDAVSGEGQADILKGTQTGWIGFTDKYWMTTLVPANGDFTSVVKYTAGSDIYQAEIREPTVEVAPGATVTTDTRLFAGAKEWEVIKAYQDKAGIQRFVDSIDWGWFFFLTKPMFWLLHWLHGAIGNMGWAIIALTLIIKALVFPLARKSYISMAKMKELQPEMEKLKEAAGGDRTKMQQGIMELYKKNKVNPAAGCLPILLQIPIFFSLYKVIYVTIELYHAPWIGWIHDLSAPDPTSILNLFGLLPFATPEPHSMFFMFSLGVLPILLGISMWFQQKLNPAPTDPSQAMIFAWMPWVFMFMLGSFASGLVLYWIANNTITFVQQYIIMSMHGARPDLFGNIRQSFKRKAKAKGGTSK